MADELTTLDESQLTPSQFEASRHNARWAQTFGRRSDPNQQPAPNLMRRYKADVATFNEDLLNEAEQRQQDLIRHDKTAQSFYFRSKELAAKHQAADEARTRADELHQFRLETEKSKAAAQHALELERTAREKEIADRTTRDALSRTELIGKWDALNKSGVEVGSGEFANKTLDLLVRHGKALDPQTRKMITDRAKVTSANDPLEAADEAISGWEAIHSQLKEKGLNARVTGRLLPSGKMGFSLSEATAPTAPATRMKEIDKEIRPLATEWRREKTKEPTSAPLVEPAIEALRKERAGLASPASPAAPSDAPAIAEAPVDPRVALARRAIDDPNATEAHKTAARKILGYQGE